MKLTVVTVKQSTTVNNTKKLSQIVINLLCWEAYHNFSRDQKKVIDRESRLILWKTKEDTHS